MKVFDIYSIIIIFDSLKGTTLNHEANLFADERFLVINAKNIIIIHYIMHYLLYNIVQILYNYS